MSEEKTATITIQIEPGKKQRMEEFFEELGLSLPYGVSLFFEQCIICAGLPQEIVDRDDQDDFIEDWQDGPKTEQIIVPVAPYKKGQVEYTLREAGMTADEAVKLYFEACLHEWGIPFRVGYPKPNSVTLVAMAEKGGKVYRAAFTPPARRSSNMSWSSWRGKANGLKSLSVHSHTTHSCLSGLIHGMSTW